MRLASLIVCLFLSWLLYSEAFGQADTLWHHKPEVKVGAYADVYYLYDFNRPGGNFREPFIFSYNRHNEINLNLGIFSLNLNHAKYRANVAFHSGTYVKDNYKQEPAILRNLYEANVGIALTKKNNLWLDAGILSSHIGFESPIAHDNWNLTRSLLAEGSPYYFSGAKLTYNPHQKIEFSALILNGWQRIQRLEGNSLPAFGSKINWKPNEKMSFNWSTFIGTDDPDSTRRMRYFNNFFGKFQPTEKLGLIAGFDLGVQHQFINSTAYHFWYSPVLIARFVINKNWKTAIRAEYYHDPNGVMVLTDGANSFKTTGLSLNLDYSPTPDLIFRLEARLLNSADPVFRTKTLLSYNTYFVGSSLAIRFSELLNKNGKEGRSEP